MMSVLIDTSCAAIKHQSTIAYNLESISATSKNGLDYCYYTRASISAQSIASLKHTPGSEAGST